MSRRMRRCSSPSAKRIERGPATGRSGPGLAPRRAQAITKVGAAVARSEAGWRIVANSAAPTVRRCRAAEALLESGTELKSPSAFNAALASDISPIDDIRSTAEYRRTVLARLLYHSLRGVAPGVK